MAKLFCFFANFFYLCNDRGVVFARLKSPKNDKEISQKCNMLSINILTICKILKNAKISESIFLTFEPSLTLNNDSVENREKGEYLK